MPPAKARKYSAMSEVPVSQKRPGRDQKADCPVFPVCCATHSMILEAGASPFSPARSPIWDHQEVIAMR